MRVFSLEMIYETFQLIRCSSLGSIIKPCEEALVIITNFILGTSTEK